ncbi:hypothetical protein GALL_512390 [mine drainage metagenome]|uniref:Uncharacterized protein n=1 Tax=mine drainage metagenome TaxID=410659 RepID=A0A1J5P8V8_9ZZZZ
MLTLPPLNKNSKRWHQLQKPKLHRANNPNVPRYQQGYPASTFIMNPTPPPVAVAAS